MKKILLLTFILSVAAIQYVAAQKKDTDNSLAYPPELLEQAREIHKKFLSVDTHTDTPLLFKRRKNFNIADNTTGLVDIPKMQSGRLDGVFMAAFVDQAARDVVSSDSAVQVIEQLIDGIYAQVERNPHLCEIATTPDDLSRLKAVNKKAIYIGIENGYGIGKEIGNLRHFRERGVTYLTLCHSYDNDICDTSSKTQNEWNGLSPFGREVVAEMNRLGMMIDLSHAGESTFWDVMKLSTKPVIASHSGCKAVFDHDRNLTDEQLRALAENGGVIQIYFVAPFIHPVRKEASIKDIMNHLEHAIKVAGIDHVGIGSDFDGGGGVIGCENAAELIHITAELLQRGYSEEDIAKIWGGNFLRVMKEVQDVGN